MPRTTLSTKGWTPVPNTLLDDLLPTLKDTELRVLLVVLRETAGRSDKPRDWLAHSQLKGRTGRASEAVSAALAVLVRSRLLVITDAAGNPLVSPAARRAHRGRLYYRLSGPLASPADGLPVGPAKAKTTEGNTRKYIGRFRNSDGTGAIVDPEKRPARREDGAASTIRTIGWQRVHPHSEALSPEQAARLEEAKAAVRARLAALTAPQNEAK